MNCFHFCISLIHLWGVTGALHMVKYQRIRGNSSQTMLTEEYPDDDPLFLRSLYMRQIICDRIIRAKQYVIISYAKYQTATYLLNYVNADFNPVFTNLQRIASTPQDPDPPYLHHRHKKIILEGNRIMYRKTLECVHTREKNWFIFLTGEEDRYLLCEPTENYTELFVTGLFEPQAEYNINFLGLDGYYRLQRYFYDEIKSENNVLKGTVPMKMTLCNLTLGEYGRLCSAAFDTLSRRDIGYFQEDVRRVNYNYLNQRFCLTKTVDLISGDEMQAQVIPCAINRVYWLPQFYILADSKVPGAIFILRHRTLQQAKINTLELVARLGKVTVLLDRFKKTRIPKGGMSSRN